MEKKVNYQYDNNQYGNNQSTIDIQYDNNQYDNNQSTIDIQYDNNQYDNISLNNSLVILGDQRETSVVDPKIPQGRCFVVCPDPYSLRSVLEIISMIVSCGTGTLVFNNDGVECIHSTEDNKILIKFNIRKDDLLSYKIDNLNTGNVKAHVRVSSLVQILKRFNKKDTTNIESLFDDTGIVRMMQVVGKDSVDRVKIEYQLVDVNLVDVYNKFYSKSVPTTKIKASLFTQMIANFRNRNCEEVIFSIDNDEGGVNIKGVSAGEVVSVSYIQSDSTIKTVENPKNDEPYQTVSGNDGPKLAIIPFGEHMVRINFSNNSGWLIKIKQTCDSNSVVSIYLEQGKPLVIKTKFGTLGEICYTFV